jgi:O-antigen/teichoic acid export membrane protein
MSGTSPFLSSVGWASAASIILQMSTVGTSILSARLLGIADYGRFSIVQSNGSMFIGIAASGLGIAATRYTARYIKSEPKRVGVILALASSIAAVTSAGASILLLIFSGYIARRAYNLPGIASVLRISAPYLFFTTLNGYQTGAMVGLGAFREMASVNAVQCLASLSLVTTFAVIWGVPGATAAIGLAACLTWVHYSLLLRRLLKQKGVVLDYSNCLREIDVFWSFAMPSTLSGIVGTLAIWLAATSLIRFGDVKQVALFNAANLLRQCILFSPTIIQRVTSISLSEMYGRSERAIYRNLILKNVIYNTAVALCIGCPLALLSAPALRLFGREFNDPKHVSLLVVLFAILEVSATSIYQAIPAAGAMWFQMGVMLLWGVCLIAVSYALVPALAALGLAWAYLAAWLVAGSAYTLISYLLLGKAHTSFETKRSEAAIGTH